MADYREKPAKIQKKENEQEFRLWIDFPFVPPPPSERRRPLSSRP